ncbi:hypothetical protein RI054_10g51600 [Pseudoscourfieldia marina]
MRVDNSTCASTLSLRGRDARIDVALPSASGKRDLRVGFASPSSERCTSTCASSCASSERDSHVDVASPSASATYASALRLQRARDARRRVRRRRVSSLDVAPLVSAISASSSRFRQQERLARRRRVSIIKRVMHVDMHTDIASLVGATTYTSMSLIDMRLSAAPPVSATRTSSRRRRILSTSATRTSTSRSPSEHEVHVEMRVGIIARHALRRRAHRERDARIDIAFPSAGAACALTT